MKPSKSRHNKGIFLLPNLLTTAALFAAFYSIVAAMQTKFEVACIAIFIAMIADALDGRVARLTGAQTKFGAEYDSIVDMVSFGIAPALLIYSWSLQYLGKAGWLGAFLYTAATALRLARFNSRASTVDRRYFQGLSSPAGAAIIASSIWLLTDMTIAGSSMIKYVMAILVVLVAILMVSNLSYYSFKDIDFKKRTPFIAGLLIVLIFITISINPPVALLLGFGAYALSGIIQTALRKRKGVKSRH